MKTISRLTLLLASGLTLTGMAQADNSFTIYGSDEVDETIPQISISDAAGSPLSNGSAMLGYLNGSWSFSQDSLTGEITWQKGSDSYKQNQLTFSQMTEIKNSFTNSLTPDPDATTWTGNVTHGGAFNLTGSSNYAGNKEIILLIESKDGSGFSLFIFKNTGTDETSIPAGTIATYPGLGGDNNIYLNFGSLTQSQNFDWYVDGLLTYGNAETGFQLVPEPATATLGLLGLAALMIRRKRP